MQPDSYMLSYLSQLASSLMKYQLIDSVYDMKFIKYITVTFHILRTFILINKCSLAYRCMKLNMLFADSLIREFFLPLHIFSKGGR